MSTSESDRIASKWTLINPDFPKVVPREKRAAAQPIGVINLRARRLIVRVR
jgi:hypothetical protein